jgi:hypothetical protein
MDGFPVSIISPCVVTFDASGFPIVTGEEGLSAQKKQSIETVTLVIKDHIFLYHYFHFVEVMITAFAFISEFVPRASVYRVIFGRQTWRNSTQNDIQFYLVQAIFPDAEIIEDFQAGATLHEKVVVCVDRFSGAIRFNKMLYPSLKIASKHFPKFRNLVVKYCRAEGRLIGQIGPRIYVSRVPPRTLPPLNLLYFLEKFRAANLELVEFDFSGEAFDRQVQIGAAAKMMVGVHGNGLTNQLWMKPGSLVVEIFPEASHYYDYQFFAEVAGHKYVGFEASPKGYVLREFSRLSEPYGNVNKEILALPDLDEAIWIIESLYGEMT